MFKDISCILHIKCHNTKDYRFRGRFQRVFFSSCQLTVTLSGQQVGSVSNQVWKWEKSKGPQRDVREMVFLDWFEFEMYAVAQAASDDKLQFQRESCGSCESFKRVEKRQTVKWFGISRKIRFSTPKKRSSSAISVNQRHLARSPSESSVETGTNMSMTYFFNWMCLCREVVLKLCFAELYSLPLFSDLHFFGTIESEHKRELPTLK